MKVTAHRIAEAGYDAVIIGFDRPCVISLYKARISPLCGSHSAGNDDRVFRYSSHAESDEQTANLHPKDYSYVDSLTIKDFYTYYSTIDLSHLTHEQHKILYSAVAEINDVTDRCYVSFHAENDAETEWNMSEIKRTDNMTVNLSKCHIKFADGSKATYADLH